MEEFGRNEFKQTILLNFEKKPEWAAFFEQEINPAGIIRSLELHFDTTINPADTLILFDEVQECGRALVSLKYFYEDTPQYHIMAAGSFLGVAQRGSFPVGKVDRVTLYPLSFYEFLEALGKDRYIEAIINQDFALIRNAAMDYEKLLKTYFLVGGMPKAVAAYAERKNLREVRSLQNGILADYKDDFSKHISPVNTPKAKIIWDSIPRHLSKEKKKFVYKEIKPGARSYAYEDAMNWLFETHLVYKVTRITENKLPLTAYADEGVFKLYIFDIGLFGAKAELDISAPFESDNKLFGIFNGAMTEQFVMQELKTAGFTPYYWGRDKGEAELDFIIQWQNEIIPVEVKSGFHKKSKSLEVYRSMYTPQHAVRTSLNNFGITRNLYSIPLYMIGNLSCLL